MTGSAKDRSAKDEARKQWTANPCGSGDHLDGLEPESLAYFDAARAHRYGVSDRWMTRHIDFASARGGKVLEIGVGMGSDLLSWAEGGAETYGIDITAEHLRLTRRNFELHGRAVDLRLCDATQIDFPDATFDVVYSNGVLHHTPDTVRCIGEAWRVLKPGGRFIVTLYHRHSLYYLVTLYLYRGLLRGEIGRLGLDGLLATVEHGADGVSIKPLVKLYTRAELRTLLGDFADVSIRVAHFTCEQLPGGRFLPRVLERLIDPRWGWYVIGEARK